MRVFASALSQFCSDMNFAVLDMVSCCNESSAMMQDKSGQEALRLIHEFAEEMGTQIAVAERLRENVLISAQYIEESDQLL